MENTKELIGLYFAELSDGEIRKVKEAEGDLNDKYYLLAFKR